MPQTDAVLKDGISGTALPVRRVAAGMKDSNHEQGVIFENKEERVWKAAQEGAAHVLVDNRKLPGIAAHPFDQGVNRLAETSPYSGGSRSCQSCALISSARAAGVKMTGYATGNAAQARL